MNLTKVKAQLEQLLIGMSITDSFKTGLKKRLNDKEPMTYGIAMVNLVRLQLLNHIIASSFGN